MHGAPQHQHVANQSIPQMALSGTHSESCSVMSNSLQTYGLYSPWNSPGQNTEVGTPGDLPNSEMKPRSPTLQADSLPAESPGSEGRIGCIQVF